MPKKLKGGSGYIKQFGPLMDQSGGNIPTCTNTTTTPYQQGQQPGLAIDISNPLLNYQMSTPFDGNKFGSALDTVQNPSTCGHAGPGALEHVVVGGAKKKSVKKTPQKKSVKKTPQKKSVKKTPQKKSVKKTPQKKSVKETSQKKSVKKTSQKKSVKKTSQKKSVKKTSQKKSVKK
jgi:outer membrane biosynthesis protein TonB